MSDEIQVRFCTTSDGVKIAFSTRGEGRPFVMLPPVPLSLGLSTATTPEWEAWDDEIERRGMLVIYDCRGAGMSDRAPPSYSLDAWVADLAAVVDALGLDQFTLFAGNTVAVPVSISYAAQRPDRVSRLILWQPTLRGADATDNPGLGAILGLMRRNWKAFCEALAGAMEDWSEPEVAHRHAALIESNHTPEGLKEAFTAMAEVDVTELLTRVTSPTLVLHRRAGQRPLDTSRKVAQGISGARLVTVDGSAASWALQNSEAVLAAIDAFLEDDHPAEQIGAAGVQTANSPASGVALSQREIEVLTLVAEGKSSREIGEELTLAVRTVERHISNIYRKIGVQNRARATAFAIHRGLTRGSG